MPRKKPRYEQVISQPKESEAIAVAHINGRYVVLAAVLGPLIAGWFALQVLKLQEPVKSQEPVKTEVFKEGAGQETPKRDLAGILSPYSPSCYKQKGRP